MHSGRFYTLPEFVLWTRRVIYALTALAIVPTVLYQYFHWHWLAMPWVPIALVGTAAAFIAGFKNNATYARAWEARQIYGGIVNASRAWGIMVKDHVRHADAAAATAVHRELIYRHIGWLTALRFQLREAREWEHMKTEANYREYRQRYSVPEWETKLEDEMAPYLPVEEMNYIMGKKNRATQIIATQSRRLRELHEAGMIETLCYVEMEAQLREFYDGQGKCERIKGFPYPRQFASINRYFIRMFVFMVPFGMLKEFEKLSHEAVWLTIPFSVLVSWVFTSLEQIGSSTENPFEGSPNDVPITAISRTIEIDLRDMLDEKDLPAPIQPVNKILM
ncbi:bestrophin family ion channel [Nemorincola caseinilytica]|uniref:Bestrophin family ion channel n=1 Tax=Nemorincola caseinilytica TaxID=2054315 RepID=A0ABP8NHW4_9BACT